jgi:hypothetical protein
MAILEYIFEHHTVCCQHKLTQIVHRNVSQFLFLLSFQVLIKSLFIELSEDRDLLRDVVHLYQKKVGGGVGEVTEG